jgi:hypothetical protein
MTTIIYTHFGNSPYLKYALASATKSNPHARKILLGDNDNQKVALDNGWEHYNLDDYDSELRQEFNFVFKWVQGKKHLATRNGKDWLRYVFERWYIVEEFCKRENINNFWHFDSDVMIVEDLAEYQAKLQKDGMFFTKQCNGTCLNGYVETQILPDFLKFVIVLYKDEKFIKSQQDEFDNINPTFAFTEMRAFNMFSKQTAYKGIVIESYFDNLWFDDCIAHDDGFETTYLPFCRKNIKKICHDKDGFYSHINNEKKRFISINCSWVPMYVFEWILDSVNKDKKSCIAENKYFVFYKCFMDKLNKVGRLILRKLK